jgi:hypothetical protein
VKKNSSAFTIDNANSAIDYNTIDITRITYYDTITWISSDLPNAILNMPYRYNNNPSYITLNLTTPTSLDAVSFVTGNDPNKSIRRWNLEGSVDGINFFTLHSQNIDYNYPNLTQFFRTSLLSFDTSVANTVLTQYAINIRVYLLSECVSFNPISLRLVDGIRFSINASTVINYNGQQYYYASFSDIFGYKGISNLNSFLSKYNPYSLGSLGFLTLLSFTIPFDNTLSALNKN